MGAIGRRTSTTVLAAPVQHTVPCLGFAVSEIPAPGSVLMDKVLPLLDDNATALRDQGVTQPRALLGRLKAGQIVPLPDGRTLDPSLHVGPMKPGRKIILLGDTSDPSNMDWCSQGADVVVHEATNCWTTEDVNITPEQVHARTVEHGHSTPQMAGAWAERMGSQELWLTHFSQRYPGDQDPESLTLMDQLRAAAAQTFSGTIHLARDFMTLELPPKKTEGFQ